MLDTSENLLKIGFIKKPHGLKGEVKVLPLTDSGDQFLKLKNCYISGKADLSRAGIQWVKVTPSDVIVKIVSVNDRDSADELRNCYIFIDRSDQLPLNEHEYYTQDLVGCSILCNNEVMGSVNDIFNAGAGDILVIGFHDREILIPMVPDFVDRVDTKGKVICVSDVEGFYT